MTRACRSILPPACSNARIRRRGAALVAVSIWLQVLTAPGAVAKSSNLSPAALQALTPAGYEVAQILAASRDRPEYLVALSGVRASDEDISDQPVILLLVAGTKTPVVEDRVVPHGEEPTRDGKRSAPLAPNFFDGMSREDLGGGDLFLVTSTGFWGGSGSVHCFDFYRVEKKKLRLVKSFVHGTTTRSYFALYEKAAYDADLVCRRGEKHGKAYVYTCYLEVTKYVFDGNEMRAVGTERMRERQGNRFLNEKYVYISVLKALQRKEIFAAATP